MHEQGADYVIDRESFEWHTNPLIHLARKSIATTTETLEVAGAGDIINELDVIIQSMLSLCHYRPEDVWQGDVTAIRDVSTQTETDFRGEAGSRFSAQVSKGLVWPNLDIINFVARKHYDRQRKVRDRLAIQYPELVDLPHGDVAIFDCADPAITTKGRKYRTVADGTTSMIVKELHSGKCVTMKRTNLELSRLYAEELHYIHKAREDEVVAFGAYLEDHELPFAWVSYSPIGTEPKRRIARNAGRDPENTLEMARAWNAAWSPKNAMSVLFSYAHNQLQAAAKKQSIEGVPAGLGGVITAINPNLGFSGMAFSGVDFGIAGLKPTNHKFLIESGLPIYMRNYDFSRLLGTSAASSFQLDNYAESSMPLSHSNVMMVLFDKSSRQKPTSPIYVARLNS